MKTCLVTGGAGFIGSRLVKQLLDDGARVRVLDNFSTGSMHNLEDVMHKPELSVVNGDVCHLDTCSEQTQSVDQVFHLAAKISVPESMEDLSGYHAVNVTGTMNVLQASYQNKVKRVVNVGSSAAYGVATQLPITEANAVSFLSPYAATKYMQEVYAQMMSESYGLETASLRFFNVFGPGQDVGSAYAAVIPIFIHRILRNEPISIYGDGSQTRDFVYVQDVVNALMAAANADADKAQGQVYQVASGSKITIKALADKLYELIGQAPNIEFKPPRQGDIQDSYASIDKIASSLGWKPETSFVDALKSTIAWHRNK